MKRTRVTLATAALTLVLGGALPETASALFLQSQQFSGNDCGGQGAFNFAGDPDFNGFSACWVQEGSNQELRRFSPSIVKFAFDDGVYDEGEASERYPTIARTSGDTPVDPGASGSEFTIDFDDVGEVGEWTYSPGAGDPGIKYWTAKAGNGFVLFWFTADDMATSLGDAVEVTSGTWDTGGQALSHLTFFNTEGSQIPEPSTLLLLGGALLAFGFRRRC